MGFHGFMKKNVSTNLVSQEHLMAGNVSWELSGASVFIPIPKKGNAKECSNYRTIVLISHASKVMLKMFHARLQQYVNCELPDDQA